MEIEFFVDNFRAKTKNIKFDGIQDWKSEKKLKIIKN